MKMVLIPGYRSLFGEPDMTYEEILKDLPSEIVISIAIMLNNELNAPLSHEENQKRLIKIISFRFSQQQIDVLNHIYKRFKEKTKGVYNGSVFGRRYLISMILKEVKRNLSFELIDTSPEQEFNLLKAYLLIIDEVNQKDSDLFDDIKKLQIDSLHEYRLLWTPQINQYQFNEKTSIAFELFKLLCFFKYALQNYRSYLKEYLHSLKFKTLGTFIYSFYQVVMATLHYNEDEVFSKLSYIKPNDNVDSDHLEFLAINDLMGLCYHWPP